MRELNIITKNPKQSLRKGRIWLIASFFGTMFIFPGVGQFAAYGQTRSVEAIRADIADFYKVYLDRELSQNELNQVTNEAFEAYGGSCNAQCVEALDSHKTNVRLFQTKRGQPEDLRMRHHYISASYFSDKTRGSLRQRLLAEPDPIRVVDPDAKRLMTEKDVIALANLGIFLQSNGSPKHQSFSPEEIDEAVVMLNRLVGSHADAQRMPILFIAAAEFWAGIQRDWPSLSATERQSVRDYIQYQSDKPMPVHLYSQLLGLTKDGARKTRYNDQLDSINSLLSRFMRVQGQAVITNTVIQGINNVIR